MQDVRIDTIVLIPSNERRDQEMLNSWGHFSEPPKMRVFRPSVDAPWVRDQWGSERHRPTGSQMFHGVVLASGRKVNDAGCLAAARHLHHAGVLGERVRHELHGTFGPTGRWQKEPQSLPDYIAEWYTGCWLVYLDADGDEVQP